MVGLEEMVSLGAEASDYGGEEVRGVILKTKSEVL